MIGSSIALLYIYAFHVKVDTSIALVSAPRPKVWSPKGPRKTYLLKAAMPEIWKPTKSHTRRYEENIWPGVPRPSWGFESLSKC
jgi:hypothetical protein